MYDLFLVFIVNRNDETNCKYFQWKDEEPKSNRGGTNRSNGQGGGGGGGYRVEADRSGLTVCSKCNQEGHYARQCPNR